MNERRFESDMKTRIPIITIVVAALLSCGAPYAFAETAGDAEVYAAPSIVIDRAAFHTVDGSTYRAENVPLRRTVAISREGATNDPPPLTPPVTEGPSGMVNSPQGASNEQISSGDVGSEVPISSSEVPLAGGNATSTIPDDSAAALNMATLIMALACLAGVVFLGFLLIKRKRDEKRLKEKGMRSS
jgi:hypothetical protein